MADIILNRTEGTIQIVSGSTLISPVRNGCFEYDGSHLCFTVGGVRKWVTLETPSYTIGDTYQGGIVLYITAPVAGATSGTAGLISKTTDGGQLGWGCYETAISGADGTSIGTGNQNTIDIHNAGCSHVPAAANYCYDLTDGTYSDWWLPSKDELNRMYVQKSIIGGFAASNYWSSSEHSSNDSWGLYFPVGDQNYSYKFYNHYVRAVRGF